MEPGARLTHAIKTYRRLHRLRMREKGRTMKLYDPTVAGPHHNRQRAVAIQSIEGQRIGILENGKLNATEMLIETASFFEQNHGCSIGPIHSKVNAGAPTPHETLKLAAENVDFLITGLGD